MTTIKAKKDLYNNGKCFTKGKEYVIGKNATKQSDLIDNAYTTNDLGEPHLIGSWWKNFKIVKS